MNIAHNRKEPSSRITAMVTGSFGPGMRQRILSQVLGIDNSARQLTCISPQRGQCTKDISFGQHKILRSFRFTHRNRCPIVGRWIGEAGAAASDEDFRLAIETAATGGRGFEKPDRFRPALVLTGKTALDGATANVATEGTAASRAGGLVASSSAVATGFPHPLLGQSRYPLARRKRSA